MGSNLFPVITQSDWPGLLHQSRQRRQGSKGRIQEALNNYTMTTNQAFKALKEQQKESELLFSGWTKASCPTCRGGGLYIREAVEGTIKCFVCDGTGYTWHSPITK